MLEFKTLHVLSIVANLLVSAAVQSIFAVALLHCLVSAQLDLSPLA